MRRRVWDLVTGVSLFALIASVLVGVAATGAGQGVAHAGPHSDISLVEKSDRQTRTFDVDWHASTGEYLLVWAEHPNHSSTDDGEVHSGDDEIRARMVGSDGTGGGRTEFVVSEGGSDKDFPKVAHVRQRKDPDEGSDRASLVVWQDRRDGTGDIFSQVVRASADSGQKVGSNKKLSGSEHDRFPGLAYGRVKGDTDVFLVAWERVTAEGESDVFARLVTRDPLGEPAGPQFRVSDDTSGRAAAPSVAYDTDDETFLVVWGDDRGGDTEERDIWGQRVDIDGNLVGSNFEINADAGLQRAPEVVAHPERDQDEFLVVWSDEAAFLGGRNDTRAQRIAGDGTLTGGVIDVADSSADEGHGPPTVNRDTGHYILPLTVDRERIEIAELGRSGDKLRPNEVVSEDTTSGKGPTAAAYGATSDAANAETASDVLTVWRDSRSGSDLTDQDLWGRFVDPLMDTDGDGIPDHIEISGIRDDTGALGTDMAALGANPCRETIAVEVDFMAHDGHTHRPKSDAIDEIVEAFDNAPRPAVDSDDCIWSDFEDSEDGIDFIVIVDEEVPYEPNVGAGQALVDIREDNFTPHRRPYFHYNLWVHDSKEDSGRSGVCCNHADFIVSLGSWFANTGTVREQSGTMMHELGHALGLGHGGVDKKNRKPNHPSVMNYKWQTRGIKSRSDTTFAIDYSREELPDLDESGLDESVGLLSSDSDWWLTWLDANFNRQYGYSGEPIDWNVDGDTDDSGLTVDTNNDSTCVKPGDDGDLDTEPDGDDVVDGKRIRTGDDRTCDTVADDDDEQRRDVGYTEPNPLQGSNDWANITFRATMAPGAEIDVDEKTTDELTFEEDQQIDEAFEEALSGDVAVTKTADRGEVLPGDTITYTVETTNVGDGDATEVELTDTFPDGTEETRTIGLLEPSETVTGTFTYTVAAGPSDGTELVNTAEATALDAAGLPEDNTDNNVGEATTVVVTPVMELDKDATTEVAAGEQITYTLIYRNVGGAAAKDVTVTDTLPEGVYYSEALDDGAGPQPDTVEPNPDGTTTLTFDVGHVPADSGDRTIEFTARPTLLAGDGDTFPDTAVLTYTDRNDNDYDPATASATTTVAAASPSQDPEGLGYWRTHDERWTDETLDRIHATDQRYDELYGSPADDELEDGEVREALEPGGNMPEMLRKQLLATYFNLAEERVVAGTAISSDTADERGVDTVAEAVRFATDTLEEYAPNRYRDRYSDATTILEEINTDTSPQY